MSGNVCDTRLSCGHQCVIKCHIRDDPDHLQYSCIYSCKKNCARSCINDHGCRRNHPCHEECEPCNILTNKTLNCGHQINVSCSVNVENLRCEKPCQRDTLSCGHDCLKKCSMACEPCTTIMKKKSIDCSYTIEVPCHQTAEKSICKELVVSAKMSFCGHVVKVPCRISDTCSPEDAVQFCHNPCGYKFDYDGGCGHTCQGNCASCYQGRIHVKCGSKCERILACGHVCKFPCSSLCPPCTDLCILKCEHSNCKKECGVPCTDCKERCRWSCSHSKCQKKCSEMCNRKPYNEPCKKKIKCGHDCIGCCGEPCPPFCRKCDKDTVQYLLFGEEDKEDARFVYLQGCGDIIHRESMDTWMSQSIEKSAVSLKRCPKCSTVITTSVRYGNIIKKQLKDVLAIRKKIFGNNQIQKEEQQLIAQRIQRHRIEDCQFESVRRFLETKIFRMRLSYINWALLAIEDIQ